MPSSKVSRILKNPKVLGLISVVVLLGVWEVSVRVGLLENSQFPAPTTIAQTMISLIVDGFPIGTNAWTHIQASAYRIIMGFLLASVIAIPLGLFVGSRALLVRFVDPIVGFSRSIAALSLLPLFVAWFGVEELTRLLLVGYAAFWIVLVNTIAAVRGIDPVYGQAARTLGANDRQIFFQVTLMASLPRIFTGLKVALGISFLVIVAVEMVGTEVGLGALIGQARTFFRSDIAMAGMVFIAIIGFLIALLMDLLERVLLPWRKGMEVGSA